MFAAITKAFGLSSPPEHHPMMPRQIDLSGNIIHFSMPENFSRDMPANDMIESVDLSDKTVYQDDQKFTLIRRWWDFKNSGFFGKEYGTVMMSLYIKEASEDLNKNILDPLEFISVIINGFKLYDKGADVGDDRGTMDAIYPDFYEAYSVKEFNRQQWMSYPVEKPSTSQHDINYAIPVSNKNYLEVSFSFAPANGISVRQFIDDYGRKHMDSIMQSFEIKYTNESQVPAVVGQPVDLQKLINEKFY